MANPTDSSMIVPSTAENPYVGPRTFTQAESSIFFGREREARELLSLVISQRLVLFYAQSGAGKSSLVNTRLIPQLRDEGFLILPTGRVGGNLPTGIGTVDNIYAFNLMLGLDQGDGDPARFSRLNLTHFLNQLTTEDEKIWFYEEESHPSDEEIPAVDLGDGNLGEVEPPDEEHGEAHDDSVTTPYVLLIDQFEEVITNHPDHWPEREAFFKQLEAAMRADPALWVVLILREDFVAALDPYAHIMSDKLRARYYMERMAVHAAHEAIRRPAELAGRPFAPGVAEQLIDNLRQVHGVASEYTEEVKAVAPGSAPMGGGSSGASSLTSRTLDQYVEPVQLQVVCYQLWENIRNTPPAPITFQNLEEAGNVDTALAAFYEDAIHAVLASPEVHVTERELRTWFANQLFTEAETRGTVYQGTTDTAGMPNEVVTLLSNQFLLRTELRAGGAWIELVHDRFVEPILKSNRRWLERQSPLMRASQRWASSDRDPALLMSLQQLEALTEESDTEQNDELITRFIRASRFEARKQAAAERAKQRETELVQAKALAEETEARRKVEAERAADAERRQQEQAGTAKRLRQLLIGITVLGLIAAVAAISAVLSTIDAQNNEIVAENNAATAAIARAEAVAESTNAFEARSTAVAESTNAFEAQSTAVAEGAKAAEQSTLVALALDNAKVQLRTATAVAELVNIAQKTNEQLENELTAAVGDREAALNVANQLNELIESQEQQQANSDATAAADLASSSMVLIRPEPTGTPTPDASATAINETLENIEAKQAADATAAVIATATAETINATVTAVAIDEATAVFAAEATRLAAESMANISLSADPPIIAPGDCSYLFWQTSTVRAVYYLGQNREAQGDGVAGVGLRRVCPTETTNYYLQVITATNQEVILEETVFVDASAPRQSTLAPIWEIWATEPSIPKDECVYIIWKTRNVREVFYQTQGVAGNDLRRECPTEDATYEIVVVTQDGTPHNQFVNVRVLQE